MAKKKRKVAKKISAKEQGPVNLGSVQLSAHMEKLVYRAVNRVKPDQPVNTDNVDFVFYKYGPFTLCKLVYTDPKTSKFFTGYGVANRSYRDKENTSVGCNVAFIAAARQAFAKFGAFHARNS